MFTLNEIAKTTAKFNEILSKRGRACNSNQNLNNHQDLVVIRKLSKGKFPIYLVYSKISNQNYAMKMFSYAGVEPPFYYQNEIRFASLKHPNIVNFVHYENEQGIIHQGHMKKVSCILTEYAPYGDFFDFLTNTKNEFDDKLTRTYFRQLIEGIEYLHSNSVAHLDLKLENLLLGADFNLKIADFDLSHIHGDAMILSRGTRNYRAPEFFHPQMLSGSSIEQLFAADIYSAGVILFVLKSGMYPHLENKPIGGVRFMDLMYHNNQEFWTKHCEAQQKEKSFFCAAFKELFNGMVKADSQERLTINQIKASMWYNGPVYTPSELTIKMKKLLYC